MRHRAEDAGLRDGFADQAFKGRNDWWRYGLVILFVCAGTFLALRFLAAAYVALGLTPVLLLVTGAPGVEKPTLAAELLAFFYLMASIIVMLPLMRVLLPWLHRRPWRSFLTARARFDGALFSRSFLALAGLALGMFLLGLWLDPGGLRWTGQTSRVLAFAPLALVLLPLQSLTEEVLFRGYLAQLTGRLTRLAPLRLLIPALLFMAAHSFNPETRYDPLWASANYLLLALYLGLISLKGRGLEASFGVHLATNLYAALIVGAQVSVSPGPTLWQSGAPDFKASFFETAPLLLVHYGLVFGLPGIIRQRRKT